VRDGRVEPGQVVELITAGGGGYGDVALRDPEAVARDVAEKRIGAVLPPSSPASTR
jgi:N-methylhydantoinase B/oxoprolinase/acetone carboxylase alpha subunit